MPVICEFFSCSGDILQLHNIVSLSLAVVNSLSPSPSRERVVFFSKRGFAPLKLPERRRKKVLFHPFPSTPPRESEFG
jgi:hypothetical protein